MHLTSCSLPCSHASQQIYTPRRAENKYKNNFLRLSQKTGGVEIVDVLPSSKGEKGNTWTTFPRNLRKMSGQSRNNPVKICLRVFLFSVFFPRPNLSSERLHVVLCSQSSSPDSCRQVDLRIARSATAMLGWKSRKVLWRVLQRALWELGGATEGALELGGCVLWGALHVVVLHGTSTPGVKL